MKFKITYQIITPTSASQGGYAYQGFVTRNGTTPMRNNFPKKPAEFSLQQAFELMRDHWDGVCPVEPSSTPVPRWLTVSSHDTSTDITTDMSIHLDHLTTSSAVRVARLFGAIK